MSDGDFFDNFVASLPANPNEAAKIICEKIIDLSQTKSKGEQKDILIYNDSVQLYKMLQFLAESIPVEIGSVIINDEDIYVTIRQIVDVSRSTLSGYADLLEMEKSKKIRQELLNKYGGAFYYEFTDGDLKNIQERLNDLRDFVTNAKDIEDEHKRRLLARLEKLQSELHKRVSDLDSLWGLIGDVGIAVGKFGEDAKPFVDRVREIIHIGWRTQAKAEELPSDAPMGLTFSDDEKSSEKESSEKSE